MTWRQQQPGVGCPVCPKRYVPSQSLFQHHVFGSTAVWCLHTQFTKALSKLTSKLDTLRLLAVRLDGASCHTANTLCDARPTELTRHTTHRRRCQRRKSAGFDYQYHDTKVLEIADRMDRTLFVFPSVHTVTVAPWVDTASCRFFVNKPVSCRN